MDVPLSSPERVIVVPNVDRIGFKFTTWKGLNEYYLQKCITQREYVAILTECNRISRLVFDIIDNEERFLKETTFKALQMFLWKLCAVVVVFLMINDWFDFVHVSNEGLVVVYGVCLFLVVLLTVYNYFQKPPPNIFVGRALAIRESLRLYFKSVNQKFKHTSGIKFNIANNDCLWMEITIPEQNQIPFSEDVVNRQFALLEVENRWFKTYGFEPVRAQEILHDMDEVARFNAGIEVSSSTPEESQEEEKQEQETEGNNAEKREIAAIKVTVETDRISEASREVDSNDSPEQG